MTAQFRSMQARPPPLRRLSGGWCLKRGSCNPQHVVKIAPLAAWLMFETTRVSAPHTLAAGQRYAILLFLVCSS